MSLTRIFYRKDSLFVDGLPTAVPPQSLSASSQSDVIVIASTHSPDPVVMEDYHYLADETGAGFSSADAAVTYLTAQFAQIAEGAAWVCQAVPITVRGQTLLPVPSAPTQYASAAVIVNGSAFRPPRVSLGATAFTWTNPDFVLDVTDEVFVTFI